MVAQGGLGSSRSSLSRVSLWKSWQEQLHTLSSIQQPRWSCYSPQAQVVEIHGFYLHVIHNSQVFVSLQNAKTRVAPWKTWSIPRLELCATHTLARLVKHFTAIVPIACNSIHLWRDSADVLCWLKDRPFRGPVFVANRSSDIFTLLPSAFSQQVCSRENFAEVASRRIEPSKLQSHTLWWQRPEWLIENPIP